MKARNPDVYRSGNKTKFVGPVRGAFQGLFLRKPTTGKTMAPSSPTAESLATLVPFRTHLIISFLLRFMFILYGEHHDRSQLVKYTDVDYRYG